MFNLDERLKGLPAVKEQVVNLFQSLNNPHLAIPGKKAGPATAFLLGLRGPSGFAAFVYLYLPDSTECAVYVPSNGTVPGDKYESEEAEALGFVESMGFIMDNLNFRGRPANEQDDFIRTLPVFQREPPKYVSPGATGQAGAAGPGSGNSVATLGKLFSAFCLALVAAGCVHIVTEKDREQAQIHYDLAVQNLVTAPQLAYQEVERSLGFDPNHAEAWHVKGILMHLSFGKVDEAKAAYDKALELKQPFSEARTNLGNVFMDLRRWDDAIKEYEQALNDVLYRAPFIAHGNMGWAYYKKGDVKNALDHLKASVTLNPKYCRGHQQLGQLHQEQGREDESCRSWGKYRESCPEQADAWQYEGVCLARAGDKPGAEKAFDTCVEKAKADDVKDQCRALKQRLLQ